MTDLTSFRVTDGVDYPTAAQYNRNVDSTLRAEISNATTMSGTVTLTDADTPIQRFNCNGANRIVQLPAYGTANHPFFIINVTAATYTLDVQTNGGVTLLAAALAANGGFVYVIPDGTAGYKVLDYIPNIAPGTFGNVLTSNGSAWTSAATPSDGWISVSDSWAYASASTITVPAGAASKYAKGDRIKLTQTTVKYFVIVGVADTVLTVLVNTDYTVANAAISAISYSHELSPVGFPGWFAAAAPSYDVSAIDDGSGGQPTTSEMRIRCDGNVFMFHTRGNGTKAATTNSFSFTRPTGWPTPANSTDVTSVGGTSVYDSSASAWCTGTCASYVGSIYALMSANITNNNTISHFSLEGKYEF